jgi:hypothetical protein
MNQLLALTALLGLLASFAVHVAALCGVDVQARWPFVWVLHLGLFLVFFPFVISCRKRLGPRPSLAELRAIFPHWIVVLAMVILAYAVLNFVLFIMATQGGNPDIRDGKHVLLNHGKLVRELTASEYSALRANEVRGFSGHWLVFYFIPFAYFMFRKNAAGTGNGDSLGAS